MGRKRAEKTGIMEKSKGMIRLQPLYALEMVVFLLLATIVGMLFRKIGFTETNVVLLYILAVFVTSSLTRGYFWGILASVAATLTFNYFFTKPIIPCSSTMRAIWSPLRS